MQSTKKRQVAARQRLSISKASLKCEHFTYRRIHGGVSSQLLRVIEPFFAFGLDGIAATPEASFLTDTKVSLSGYVLLHMGKASVCACGSV